MKKCVIVHYGRNDRYHEDYLARTSYCLNHNLSRIRNWSEMIDLSIVFVDFLGPNPPLSEVLSIQRSNKGLLHFIEFSELHDAEVTQSNRGFSTAIAANVAIRHVDADFYIIGASDLIGSSTFWNVLPSWVEEESTKECFSFIPRRYLPREFLRSIPTTAELEYLMDHVPIREERLSKAYGNSGWMCGSAAFFQKAGGWNENFKGWGGDDTEMFLATAGFSTPGLASDTHALRVFKWPYAQDGARTKNQYRAINPFELTGARQPNWGYPNGTFVKSEPKLLIEKPPLIPKSSELTEKKTSTFYWFLAIRRSIKSFNDLRNAYRIAQLVRSTSGYCIATYGRLSLSEWLTICFFRRFSVMLCFVKSDEMQVFVSLLHRLETFMSRLDRNNTYNGVVVPINLDLPSSYTRQHAYHPLIENKEVLVLARCPEGRICSGTLHHQKLFDAVREGVLLQWLKVPSNAHSD